MPSLTYQVTETMKVTDDILWTALSGVNKLLLTPRMIGIQLLERIVSSNAILRDTVFADHPNVIYSLVNIHLLELKGGLDLAHFILDLPLIKGSNNVGIFRSAQVGISVGLERYIYYDLPTYSYKAGEVFYEFS